MPNINRNNYSLEFKVSSAHLAVDSDQPIDQTARDLGINHNTLHNWIAKYSDSNQINQKNMSNNRIGRLMVSAGLFCKTKRRFKVTNDYKHNNPIAPNLLDRQFDVSAPDKYWVGDITYIPTRMDGFIWQQ